MVTALRGVVGILKKSWRLGGRSSEMPSVDRPFDRVIRISRRIAPEVEQKMGLSQLADFLAMQKMGLLRPVLRGTGRWVQVGISS